MQSLWLCCCLLWEGLITIEAHPVSPITSLGTQDTLNHWELNWIKYAIGLLGITITAFALVGCLCCRRNRRPKGFQEFKDGISIENDPSIPHLQGLELQVPSNVNLSERVQFEPIPVERIVPEICVAPRPKPPPPSPSIFEDESESDRSTLRDSCHEWFQKTDLHVPREKLKYLREIGHGWFGKVVEGCAELQGINLGKSNVKSSNVVVRILTEEATAKEKAWFLGEATPYFKLRHRNILSLFGSCLETDPYLLLFESCPLGDLKSFLHSNRDSQSQKVLINENMPTRIAIEIGAGLRHMHEHGLAHTDLSARNCLVASDLSIKLGDYGIGVEKYPGDYYVLGDRALPIRWSAPETVECTETTIETREITPRANLWSYAVLLWEIAMWGERPYDDLEDEKVIEMLLSSKSRMKAVGSQLLLQNSDSCASNLLEAIKSCLVLEPDKRLSLDKIRHTLLKDQLEAETSDFDQRWLTSRPNITNNQVRSASLQDLRGSIDSEQWSSLTQTSFRLGPEEPVKNVPGGLTRVRLPFKDSDSETEEESWRGRVERGAYTEKVKQKSKSVADLMVLVHIEPDSDADISLGPQIPMAEKIMLAKKRLSSRGSDSDLPSAIFDDQFDLALRKLRDPLVPGDSLIGPIVPTDTFSERPKVLTLTTDQGQPPILRLAFDPKQETIAKEKLVKNSVAHVLRGESILGLADTSRLKESMESQTKRAVNKKNLIPSCFSNNFQVTDLDEDDNKIQTVVNGAKIDVDSWNSALDKALQQKEISVSANVTPVRKIEGTNEEAITPSPQSRAEYSAEDAEDELSNADDLPGLSKRHFPMDEEDDRKRMSTPDDERSSDSGFRDKESCEEEESPLPGPLPSLSSSQPNTPRSLTTHDSAEEEQLRILFELDTILDAECYSTLNDSLDPTPNRNFMQEAESSSVRSVQKDNDVETEISENVQSSSEATGETEKEIVLLDKSSSDDVNLCSNTQLDSQRQNSYTGSVDSAHRATLASEDISLALATLESSSSWPCLASIDIDDEDSSTMSMRSDNSYVPIGIDEDFVTAIRNELKEKLPHAQMSVIETQELRDEDGPSLVSDVDSKNWEDELEDELAERSGVVDISIRYNTFGTPLSPILEERESASNSESVNLTRDDSQDVSIASKGGSNSLSEDDVLLIDTQTNRATIVEGTSSHPHDCQESLVHEALDGDNRLYHQRYDKRTYPLDKRLGGPGAPLPSPEEEACKWQQQMSNFPMLPPQLEDNLMSTSFASEQDWDSDEEGREGMYDEAPMEDMENEVDDDEDDDEGEDGVEEDEDDDEDEENSSSSGEFVWQQYGAIHQENNETENIKKDKDAEVDEAEDDEEFETDDDEEEEEFTPSAWNAALAPHRSALRSPDKTMKSGEQKKSVWFKKQRYHCVYEYPKETPPMENSPTVSAWEPTSYTDWEEMIGNMDRFNYQPMDYFETNNTRGDDEFFVSSSNRPFQFQSGNGKYLSQFFPGASSSNSTAAAQDGQGSTQEQNEETAAMQQQSFCDRQQLGELRHTRDRLKLNLVSSNGASGKLANLCNPAKQGNKKNDDDDIDDGDDDDDDDGNDDDDEYNNGAQKKEENDNKIQKMDKIEKTEIIENIRDGENNIKTEVTTETRTELCKDEADNIVNESSNAQQPLTIINTSPSTDGQSSSGNLESKRRFDDFDVD